MSHVDITLAPYELHAGSLVGFHRRLKCLIRNSHDDTYGTPTWTTDIEAALAEMAFAKWAGVYWDFSVDTYKAPDVSSVQIRWSNNHSNKLIFRPNKDNKYDKFVLVTGLSPTYRIHGWMYGKDAMREDWLFAPKGDNGYERPAAYFVPASSLKTLSTLKL
jgi:hypothetical protein